MNHDKLTMIDGDDDAVNYSIGSLHFFENGYKVENVV